MIRPAIQHTGHRSDAGRAVAIGSAIDHMRREEAHRLCVRLDAIANATAANERDADNDRLVWLVDWNMKARTWSARKMDASEVTPGELKAIRHTGVIVGLQAQCDGDDASITLEVFPFNSPE